MKDALVYIQAIFGEIFNKPIPMELEGDTDILIDGVIRITPKAMERKKIGGTTPVTGYSLQAEGQSDGEDFTECLEVMESFDLNPIVIEASKLYIELMAKEALRKRQEEAQAIGEQTGMILS